MSMQPAVSILIPCFNAERWIAQAIESALEGLTRAQAAVAAAVPHEMLLLDVYAALRGLDTLTGATTADDVLNLIFSTFCIGK